MATNLSAEAKALHAVIDGQMYQAEEAIEDFAVAELLELQVHLCDLISLVAGRCRDLESGEPHHRYLNMGNLGDLLGTDK